MHEFGYIIVVGKAVCNESAVRQCSLEEPLREGFQ
jgi:hypothetical protein